MLVTKTWVESDHPVTYTETPRFESWEAGLLQKIFLAVNPLSVPSKLLLKTLRLHKHNEDVKQSWSIPGTLWLIETQPSAASITPIVIETNILLEAGDYFSVELVGDTQDESGISFTLVLTVEPAREEQVDTIPIPGNETTEPYEGLKALPSWGSDELKLLGLKVVMFVLALLCFVGCATVQYQQFQCTVTSKDATGVTLRCGEQTVKTNTTFEVSVPQKAIEAAPKAKDLTQVPKQAWVN